MRKVEYTDGELILNDDGTLTAIGEYANKVMYRLWACERKGIQITDKLFDALNECRIIL